MRTVLKNAIRRLIWLAAQLPWLRPLVIAYYERERDGIGWSRTHPFDREHGVRTSGVLPGFVLKPGDPLDAPTIAYGAIQPSTIRTALRTIPALEKCAFLDFGCGKGRPLLVASEFAFRSITGVEFAPELARVAARNAQAIARRDASRTRIDIVTGDALAHAFPAGDVVLFLYNPFGRDLIDRVAAAVTTSLRTDPRRFYVVYANPVWPTAFDASPALERRFADQLPYAPEERGYGPQDSEAVVIWQDRGNPHPRPPGDPDRPVVIRNEAWLAEIGPSEPP